MAPDARLKIDITSPPHPNLNIKKTCPIATAFPTVDLYRALVKVFSPLMTLSLTQFEDFSRVIGISGNSWKSDFHGWGDSRLEKLMDV